MAITVYIREVYKRIDHHNPMSGHSWTTAGPTTGYEVIGAVGVSSMHTSETKAIKEAAELQAFYIKFNL